MDLTEEIKRLAAGFLKPEQFVVDVIVTAKKGPGKVIVLVDGDSGVNIDDCAELSRQLSKALDEIGLIDDRYVLEVSTPGVDQPLKLQRQYRKHVGRTLKLKISDRMLDGKLVDVTDDQIIVNEEIGTGKKKENVSHTIAFRDIDKAFVMVSFK